MSEQDQTPDVKANRPFYKKKRIWLLGIIALIVFAQATSGDEDSSSTSASQSSESSETVAAEPALVVTAEELVTALDENALAAKTTYEDKLVTITGKLSNIDASGDYFSLEGAEYSFTNIQIFINDSFIDTVSKFKIGQTVTVTGKITSVGEILGYSVDAISIP